MPIRRMKSMSGIRRLWSDYGMEGILREANLKKAMNFGVYLVSGCALSFSIAVWACRQQDPATVYHLVQNMRQITAVPVEESLSNELVVHVLDALKQRGIPLEDLRRAAAHLKPIDAELLLLNEAIRVVCESKDIKRSLDLDYNPVMRSVCEEACRVSIPTSEFRDFVTDAIVKSWIDRGFFNFEKYPDRTVFGNRETSEAIGVDIGSTVHSLLYPTQGYAQFIGSDDIRKAVFLIEQWGFAVVQKAVSEKEILRLLDKLKLSQGPASECGENIKKLDANVSHSRAMVNRLNLIIRGSKLEEDFRLLHTAVSPLVCTLHSRQAGEAGNLILSDTRIVVVDEGAEKTNWTVYNPRGGYTVLIPLHDRDHRMGTQAIIPGSHFLVSPVLNVFKRVSWTMRRLMAVPFPVQVTDIFPDGCWRSGDALVIDNRLLVRAEENKLFKSGTYILMKYETPDAATGGLYLAGKIVFRLAELFEAVARWSIPRN
jgi:hypothetical protein